MTGSTPETLSSDERPEGSWTSRRRRGAPGLATAGSRATALTAALSLVLVGGIATAAYRATQSSSGPDTLVPANAFAFGSIDLSLPGGQDAALRNFLDHFSGSPTRTGTGSTTDRILRAVFKDSSDPKVDYDTDIKPWLGDHVAGAGWLDSSGDPQFEVLVQTTDSAKALSTIRRLNAESGDNSDGVITSGDYIVVANTTKLANEAVADAKQSSLAGQSLFTSDINQLPGDDPAVGWLDGAGASKAIHSALGTGNGGAFGIGPFGAFGALGGLNKLANTHVAVGLHAADNYVQLDEVAHGSAPQHAASSNLLTQLPKGTVAGVELGDPGTLVDSLGKVFTLLTSAFAVSGESGGSSFSCTATPALRPGDRQELKRLQRRLLRGSHLTAAERRQMIRQFAGATGAKNQQCTSTSPLPMNSVPLGTVPAPQPNPLQAFSQFTGLKFPDDVKTLLGDSAVIAYGGLGLGYPQIGLRSHPTDLQAAHDKAVTLQNSFESHAGIGIDVENAGEDLVIASTPTYGSELAAKGTLGEQDGFRTAMGDVPSTVDVAVYVNLGNLWTTATLFGGGVPDAVQKIKGLGIWATHDGDTQRAQFRLVVG